MQEVYEFLKKCKTYYLGTVEDGQPRVRPFGTADIFDGKLYIQTGKGKDVSKQMANDPRIEICAFDGANWVRIEATATNDDSREAKAHMLDAHPNLRSRYSEDDDNTQVLWLKDATATFWGFSDPPRIVKF